MISVYLKELKSYSHNLLSYILMGFLMLMTGIFTMAYCLKGYCYSNFEYALSNMMVVLLLVVPLFTMSIIAGERRRKTDILLYSLPLTGLDIALGKYLALITVWAAPMVIMCFYPLILTQFGTVNIKVALSAILGFYLLCCALSAVCMFISSLTDNQIVAAVISFFVLLLNYFMQSLSSFAVSTSLGTMIVFTFFVICIGLIVWYFTKNLFTGVCTALILEIIITAIYFFAPSAIEGLLPNLMNSICLFGSFYNFIRGIFDITSIVLMLGVSTLFVFLTVQSIEKRRWS